MVEFRGEDAYLYGTKEAIVINYFRYWIGKNKANEKHFYDEHFWTYNSVRALTEVFYYWSEKQIRRVIDSLVEKGVLIKGNYNKTAYDRTSWYAFANEDLFLNEYLHLPKKINDVSQNGKMTFPEMGEPIPISNTISNTVNNIEPIKKKSIKKKFIPPTLEQVKDYCVNVRKNNVDYKRFYDYYEANDWNDGNGKPLVSWKQKIIAVWEKDNKQAMSTRPQEENRKAFRDMTEEEKREYWRKIDAEIAEQNRR